MENPNELIVTEYPPFPHMLVINLASRNDKWDIIRQEFYKLNWPLLYRILALLMEPGWLGCTKSHIQCIQLAKDNKLPWVLLLEDDCLPAEDGLERFTKLLPSLWKQRSEWDIFMGGLTNASVISIVQQEPPLLSVKGNTAHFSLIHEGSYDKFLHDLQSKDMFVDGYYNLDPSVRIFCTVPHIATQAPGHSDIVGYNTNYTTCFSESEQVLLEAVKALHM